MNLNWFSITSFGVSSLALPPGAQSFDDLTANLPAGVYSVFRTFGHNRFLELEKHLDRTDQSMALLGWPDRLDRAQVCAALDQVCTAAEWEESRVRLDVLPAPFHLQGKETRMLVALHPLQPPPAEYLSKGVTAALAPGLKRENPLAKSATFAQQRKSYLAQHLSQAYENLLVGEDGAILEGSSTNFYAVLNGVLRTAGTGVLEGITRTILLERAALISLPVQLDAVRVEELLRISEAMISSSSRGIFPVVKIDDQQVGPGVPGPVFKRLSAAYETYVASASRRAVE